MSPAPGARRGSRPARRWGLLACLVLLALLAGAGPASAHATLVSTDPAEGEVLADAPEAVTFTFDEPVSLAADAVQVFDAAGEPVESESASRGTEVTTDLPASLADGTYVVVWRAVSADGHPVAGSLSFSIGAPSLTVAAPDVPEVDGTTVRSVLSVTQAVGYVGLLTAGGLVVFLCWTTAGVRLDPAVRRRLRRLLVGAGVTTVVAGVVGLPLTAAYQQGVGLGGLSLLPEPSLVGDELLVLGLQLVGLVAATLLLGRPRAAVPLVGVAVLAPALVGHSRAIDPVWLIGITDALHLAAGATWMGGLVALAVALPSLSGRSRDGAAVLTRFSELAAGLLAVLAITGVLLGSQILGSWSALLDTGYGRLLLLKVGIAGVVAAAAGWNRWRLLPAVRSGVGHGATQQAIGSVARAVRVEAALLVVLLAVTGFLVNLSPRPEPVERAAVASRVEVGALGESRVLATLSPQRVGPTTLTVQVQTPEGEPFDGFAAPVVSLRSVPPDDPTGAALVDLGPQPVAPTGVGTYAADVVLPAPGTWVVQVSLRASEFDNPVTTVSFEVAP